MPRDKDIYGSDIEEAITSIFDVAKCNLSSEILAFAKKLGIGPIRVLFRWADEHVKNSLSADIKWWFGRNDVKQALIQKAEFKRLRDIILQTSDQHVTELEVNGVLQGADVSKHTFHLKLDSGEDIRGSSGDIIGSSHTVELPKRYKAKLRKTKTVSYSTEEEHETNELLALNPE